MIPPQKYAEIDSLRVQYGICDIETDIKKKALEWTGAYKFNFGKWHAPINFH